MDLSAPRTVSGLVDELERIQQELFRLQKALEKMEKAEAGQGKKARKSVARRKIK